MDFPDIPPIFEQLRRDATPALSARVGPGILGGCIGSVAAAALAAANAHTAIVALDPINNLQHAGVHPLGAVAGERSFGHDERLESNERKRRFQIGVATNGGRCFRCGPEGPCLVQSTSTRIRSGSSRPRRTSGVVVI